MCVIYVSFLLEKSIYKLVSRNRNDIYKKRSCKIFIVIQHEEEKKGKKVLKSEREAMCEINVYQFFFSFYLRVKK